MREYLQVRVLEALQRAGAFESWAFLGGTALRFLFQLPRFSEDLDFSHTRPKMSEEAMSAEFRRFLARVRKTFETETYEVDLRERTGAVVKTAFLGFPGLLHELGLSGHRGQKLSIKIEVDTNPPAQAST